jgi:hypothetical protein
VLTGVKVKVPSLLTPLFLDSRNFIPAAEKREDDEE